MILQGQRVSNFLLTWHLRMCSPNRECIYITERFTKQMITRFSAHWRAKKFGTSAVPTWSRKLGEAYGVLAFSTHLEAREAECPGGEGWQEQRWLWCRCIHQQAVKEGQAESIWTCPELESVAHSGECIPLSIHPLGHWRGICTNAYAFIRCKSCHL